MAIKKKTVPTRTIMVRKGQSIFLTINIGNAQIGASIIKFIEGSTVFAKGNINLLLLGTADGLDGKTIQIVTNILDANPSTNKIVVIDEFKNGDPTSIDFDDEVASEGDIFSLTRTFTFKKRI